MRIPFTKPEPKLFEGQITKKIFDTCPKKISKIILKISRKILKISKISEKVSKSQKSDILEI